MAYGALHMMESGRRSNVSWAARVCKQAGWLRRRCATRCGRLVMRVLLRSAKTWPLPLWPMPRRLRNGHEQLTKIPHPHPISHRSQRVLAEPEITLLCAASQFGPLSSCSRPLLPQQCVDQQRRIGEISVLSPLQLDDAPRALWIESAVRRRVPIRL